MTTYITIPAKARNFTFSAKARDHSTTARLFVNTVDRVTSQGATRVTSQGAIRVINRESTIYAFSINAKKIRFSFGAKNRDFVINAKKRNFRVRAKKVNQ